MSALFTISSLRPPAPFLLNPPPVQFSKEENRKRSFKRFQLLLQRNVLQNAMYLWKTNTGVTRTWNEARHFYIHFVMDRIVRFFSGGLEVDGEACVMYRESLSGKKNRNNIKTSRSFVLVILVSLLLSSSSSSLFLHYTLVTFVSHFSLY